MITIDNYVGVWKHHVDWNGACQNAAEILLDRVNRLLAQYVAEKRELDVNKKTGTNISGEVYGGFRPLDCPIGAKQSSHKLGMAVDVYDPYNTIDMWLDVNPDVLEKYDLYRENPGFTKNWCHLTTKAPKSGKRTFIP